MGLTGGDESFLHVRTRIGEKFKLQKEGTVLIKPDSLRLRFTEAFDSRCPKDAVCVWAGEAEARLTLTPPGQQPASFSLRGFIPEDGYEEGIPEQTNSLVQDTLGYRVSLLRLDPYPTLDNKDDPAIAALRVDRLSE